MKTAFIGLIFLLSTFVCDAAQFRTTAEFIYQTNGIKEHRDEAWSAKRPILEVGEDVTWNWGTVSEGIVMGTRFTKITYAAEEPIELQILVRNVSEQATHFAGGLAPTDDFKIAVSDGENRLVPELRDLVPSTGSDFQRRLNKTIMRAGSKPFPLPPETQHIYLIRLDELFDLDRSGRYFVTATHGVPKLDGSGYGEVRSGVATADFSRNTKQTFSKSPTNLNHGVPRVQNEPQDNSSARNASSTSSNPLSASEGTNARLPNPTTTASSTSATKFFPPTRPVGIGILVVLLAPVLFILWRAARRKPEA
ncbi:MAG TPA: hypothetical protein VGF13_11195 [Verrucomicrobiae bacterium]|jgi:hypothetical protein